MFMNYCEDFSAGGVKSRSLTVPCVAHGSPTRGLPKVARLHGDDTKCAFAA